MIILIKQYHQAVKNEKICPKPLGFTERRIMFLEPNEKDAHPKGRAFFFFFFNIVGLLTQEGISAFCISESTLH